MKILVTGGAGFIGSHVAEECAEAGHTVRVLDDLSTGREENIERDDIELVVGDFRDAKIIERCLDGVDAISHLAAVASVPESFADPLRSATINLNGTLGLLDAARRGGVRRLVFASSAAVYGDPKATPIAEAHPRAPQSPYGVEKLAGELACQVYARYGKSQLDTVSFRYFNVFGRRQRADAGYAAALPNFHAFCARGEAPTVFGDGRQTRDFVSVSDVARLNRLALETDQPWNGEILNVGTGRATEILELARGIAKTYGIADEPRLGAPREGDIRDSVANVTALRSAMSERGQVWNPTRTPLDEVISSS